MNAMESKEVLPEMPWPHSVAALASIVKRAPKSKAVEIIHNFPLASVLPFHISNFAPKFKILNFPRKCEIIDNQDKKPCPPHYIHSLSSSMYLYGKKNRTIRVLYRMC